MELSEIINIYNNHLKKTNELGRSLWPWNKRS